MNCGCVYYKGVKKVTCWHHATDKEMAQHLGARFMDKNVAVMM